MTICVPVTREGLVDPRWGRAERVAVASVRDRRVESWHEYDVGWGTLHDAGPEGAHHARVARFLREHGVSVIVAEHMGPGMARMVAQMGIAVRLGASGPARDAVLDATKAN